MFDSRDRAPKSRGTSGTSTPTATPEELAKAKLAARAEKKAEWERRKAAGDVPAALRGEGEGAEAEGGKAE